MRRTIIAGILVLGLLLMPSVVSAASGVEVESKTGDGIWVDDTWQVEIFPGETKSTTITLYNSSSRSLDVEVTVLPDSLDGGSPVFELSDTSFTMLGKSNANITLTVKATGSATPGTYTTELEIKSEIPRPAGGGGGGAAPDTKPPRIYDVSLCGITETTADICWRTKEKSTSQVEYWSSPIKLSSLNEEYVVEHSVRLTKLTPATVYFYRTMSEDRAGNLEVSEKYSFTTLEEEVIEPEPTPPEPEEPVIPEPAEPTEPEPAPPEPEPEREIHWGLIAGVIGGLVIAVVGIVYWRKRQRA